MSENTAIFTISLSKTGFNIGGCYNIKSKKYNLYNQLNISRDCLYTAMCQLADVFNNVLNIPILFEIE